MRPDPASLDMSICANEHIGDAPRAAGETVKLPGFRVPLETPCANCAHDSGEHNAFYEPRRCLAARCKCCGFAPLPAPAVAGPAAIALTQPYTPGDIDTLVAWADGQGDARVHALRDVVHQLRARLAAVEADAARLDWLAAVSLREGTPVSVQQLTRDEGYDLDGVIIECGLDEVHGADIRAALDAARGGSGPGDVVDVTAQIRALAEAERVTP
jgi:hypothetical protein